MYTVTHKVKQSTQKTYDLTFEINTEKNIVMIS